MLHDELKRSFDPLDLVSLANRVVDCYFDDFGATEIRAIQHTIRDVLKLIWSTTTDKTQDITTDTRVELLVQAAALHRCRALSNYVAEERSRRLSVAWRCADKALRLAPNSPTAQLARGQAGWYHAVNIDARSADYLTRAEEDIRGAADSGYNIANLVLARFYRYTYRPNLAISVFTDYQQSEPVRRKVLSEAYVVGEAAWQLWWRNGSSALPQVEIARNLLSESVEAGYLNARTVISLAMLEAILGPIGSATAMLARLQIQSSSEPILWESLIETASNYAEANDVEALRRMFSFGFDNGASWNSLGTFVREFLNDDALALRLYNVGLKLSPKNHYLWLNKARILARLGQAGEAAYARRTARQFAPHVFLPFIDEVSEQDASESL